MAKQTLNVHTVTTRRLTVQLDRKDLVTFLESKGFKIPRDASVYFQVPGGADWSGMAIDIDSDNPVTVAWSELEESSNG